MLTPYDEFPVHQASRPFSHLPSTDHAWDDGYFFGVYSAEAKLFLFTGMRVNANADVIGGYAGVIIDGRQYTTRLSRVWRPEFETRIGPLAYRFVEPMKAIHISLQPATSELSFDLDWRALAPPHEEEHHLVVNRGRITTDQTRYTQSGTASGSITFRGVTYEVSPTRWSASRDHSWGLYRARYPLSAHAKWLPPPEAPAVRRALRFWMPFQTPGYSGFYQFHEDEEGRQLEMNDIFGTAFQGAVDYGFDSPPIRFKSAQHRLSFFPGTRSVCGGVVTLIDEQGRTWRHELSVDSPPWLSSTIGYNAGSWKDGGSISTYHGPGVYTETDEFDFSKQPIELNDYLGSPLKAYGNEHLVTLRSVGPDGEEKGLAHLEFLCEGRYRPYGFE